ncbi:hypothetical protein MHBO_000540 [Bonamia ostreae]|uniref:Uncharacterized protein n=1 Tax=Bonamia ostreae TaxID=126728 RepID=A0ABV2AGS9_9EUKA
MFEGYKCADENNRYEINKKLKELVEAFQTLRRSENSKKKKLNAFKKILSPKSFH